MIAMPQDNDINDGVNKAAEEYLRGPFITAAEKVRYCYEEMTKKGFDHFFSQKLSLEFAKCFFSLQCSSALMAASQNLPIFKLPTISDDKENKENVV